MQDGKSTNHVYSNNNAYRIPTDLSGEAVGVAPRVVPCSDVSEGRRRRPVQERVEEPKHWLARCDQPVVDQTDDTGEDGAGATGSSNETEAVVVVDLDVVADSRDVGEGTTSPVESAGVGVAEFGEVGGDCRGLVGGLGEDVGETTGGEGRGGLSSGGSQLSGTNGGHASNSRSEHISISE